MLSRALSVALLLAAGCASHPDAASEEQNVAVDTESELAWAQYLANFELAESYAPRCAGIERERPRVLVTGYGRFLSVQQNATGQMVSHLLPELEYPLTEAPPRGEIDPPGGQTRAAVGTIALPGVGEVDVCAMVLPVFWDLAAVLVLKELEVFEPDLVVMNGVADSRQPLWLELGSLNRAMALTDGSGILTPVAEGAPLIPSAPEEELARPNLLSWQAVRDAAKQSIELESSLPGGEMLSEVLLGASLAGYPRSSNTYLCNNVTYTVGYLMDHPGEVVRLMEASHVREGHPGAIEMTLTGDYRHTPRVFVHWPSRIAGETVVGGAYVMRAMIGAQLEALASGPAPIHGHNDIAEIPADGAGPTY